MPSYLEQYTRFSQGIAQQQNQPSQLAKAMSDFGRIQAQRNQAEAKRQAEIRKKIVDDSASFDGSDMWQWQANVEAQHIAATGQLLNEGKISELEYEVMLNGILADVEKMKVNYRSEVGNPETAKPTDSTFYGYMGAVDEWVSKGKNVYEDDRVIIAGLNQGDEGVARVQMELNNRFRARNLGKSSKEQVLGGFYDENLQWTYRVGDPNNPSSIKNIPSKDFLSSNEGPNAFLMKMDMVDPRVMADYAASKQAEEFVQDGDTPEIRQYYNVQFARDKHFRRDVYDQFAPSVFEDEESYRTMKSIFVNMDESGMSFDGDGVTMNFDRSNPNAHMFEKIWNKGQENLVNEYKSRHKDDLSGGDASRSEMVRYDQVIPIEFDAMDAYDDVVKELTVSGVQSQGLSYTPIKPEAFQNLKPLTGLETAMKMGGGEDLLVGATRANGDEFGELDGELIGKFAQKVAVKVPSVGPEVAALYRERGLDVPTEDDFQTVYYYRKLNDSQKEAFYKEIGQKLNYPPGERQKAGEEYIYNKYVLGQ